MYNKRRITNIKVISWLNQTDGPQVLSSFDAFISFKEFFPEDIMSEKAITGVMFLNHHNQILRLWKASIGNNPIFVPDVRMILITCIRIAAKGVIICHNYISGNIQPTEYDLTFIERLKEGCKILDIAIIDHIIISQGGKYFSFADKGLI